MKKIVALLLCLVTLGSFCVTSYAATTEAATEFQLEIDVEERYTDISDMDDYHKTFLDVEEEEEEKKDSRTMISIVILSVLLVIAIIILIVSLKRVPAEDDGEESADDSARDKTSSESDGKISSEEKTEE